jgi:transposase
VVFPSLLCSIGKPTIPSPQPNFGPPSREAVVKGCRFYEVAQATKAPIATEALRRIAELYAIGADVRGQSPARRLAARRNRSKPLVEAMRLWFEAQLPLLSGRGTLPKRSAYALSRWERLTRSCTQPREARGRCAERPARPPDRGDRQRDGPSNDRGGSAR